ncbi:MAG: NAD-dependent epimerase/dehydratase family protein [Nitrospina sp.]|jgi:dihydroflavonol-4-reductase|nr:NAD-dependent epimerase/dehydratase family protein [Nitrospina sp.]MBT5633110.1 NAD-dependent epimerase/dehydratase family protein [Nitrospina sp.]
MIDLSHLKGATALVTGANGFIGSHLVDQLLASGCTVHGLVRETSNLKWLDTSQIHLHKADLVRPDFKVPDLEDIDYIFHCAGLTKAKSRSEYFEVNATACSVLYEQCEKRGSRVKGIVHLSSLAATGPSPKGGKVDEDTPCRPVTYYGQSKLAGEEIARKFSGSLPITVIRPPVVYGPREENFFTFIKLIHKGWGLQIGKAGKELSLIYVADLVQAMLIASKHAKQEGHRYFVTDGQVYIWEQVAKESARIMNIRLKTLKIPEGVLSLAALLFEGWACFSSKAALFDRQRMIDIQQSSWSASPDKFFEELGFEPQYDLSRGLTETIKWYQEQKWL